MKKMFVLIAGLLVFTTVTNAQKQDSTKSAKAKEKYSNMDSTRKQNLKDKGITKKNMDELGLTKDQEKQMEQIHSNARKEKEKINNDNTLTDAQKQEKIKSINEEQKTKTNAILTPEQREKIKKQRANKKKNNSEEGS